MEVRMQKNMLLVISLLFLFSACTWVEPTLKGKDINYVEQNAEILKNCQNLGSVHTMVKHEIAGFKRSAEKVEKELITIAKNEAAEMGGDTVAPEGPSDNGRRAFSVYKCMDR